jgi:hypothetical protein
MVWPLHKADHVPSEPDDGAMIDRFLTFSCTAAPIALAQL